MVAKTGNIIAFVSSHLFFKSAATASALEAIEPVHNIFPVFPINKLVYLRVSCEHGLGVVDEFFLYFSPAG